ncbi:hypothetical protein PROFUN_03647 [Planoprotostelium fungivorum]|uniref:protein acetyllysine N-acetyltransferase n=1 Tax=Planoprotostelium fungivorum TaxID=1890364 RepID=A0A2P6NDI4_9EUKA|nr:hypothetical protein PROFUN_03700 [Planoprotostelium fungivorum]PRP86899.1 hypothetical protein PROFUN_03647 [Planoprotostelium fungivorum]
MASTYAAKLKKGVRYGLCGSPEYHETEQALSQKVEDLVKMINESERIVVFTGAGISTSVGLPDFRGPNGVWTLEKKGLLGSGDTNELSWDEAIPSLAHMAIVTLYNNGKVRHCVSQNVDGLHLRSGLPVEAVSELHGNVFAEKCEDCERVYYRENDVDSIGFQLTGKLCEDKECGGRLRDLLLDWDDELPADQYERAQEECRSADLVICLGTSLRVVPADKLPLMTRKNGGRVVIINLQKTPKDSKASLVIRAKCDRVMASVISRLRMKMIPFLKLSSLDLTLSPTGESPSLSPLKTSEEGWTLQAEECVNLSCIQSIDEKEKVVTEDRWKIEWKESPIEVSFKLDEGKQTKRIEYKKMERDYNDLIEQQEGEDNGNERGALDS